MGAYPGMLPQDRIDAAAAAAVSEVDGPAAEAAAERRAAPQAQVQSQVKASKYANQVLFGICGGEKKKLIGNSMVLSSLRLRSVHNGPAAEAASCTAADMRGCHPRIIMHVLKAPWGLASG